jgi:hypothetical protein
MQFQNGVIVSASAKMGRSLVISDDRGAGAELVLAESQSSFAIQRMKTFPSSNSGYPILLRSQ